MKDIGKTGQVLLSKFPHKPQTIIILLSMWQFNIKIVINQKPEFKFG